ncbi:MAG: tRNA preQ1(34) S-adenosylmethionine ribosyltransferase-isomerase QueA [Phycisphaerae bacterium]|nr:tRNA preQ1(34) S-adenosylmethionine ribosyltransferase-isomerase QueA [Phycisphaerae bacterium]
MGTRLTDLDFDLDPELIATDPAEPRDSARLLEVRLPPEDRDDGSVELRDRVVSDLPGLLHPGDRIVLNRTRVVPARISCLRSDTGGRLDGLLAEPVEPGCWWAMLRRSRRLRVGHTLVPLDHAGNPLDLLLTVEEVDEEGRVRVRLGDPDRPDAVPADLVARLFAEAGLVPLPPYILRARREHGASEDRPEDRGWYQTTFAGDGGVTASVAAPTAGLHLTPELLQRMEERGCTLVKVSLEVGAGTFKPVESDDLDGHVMHSERCFVDAEAIERIREADEARRASSGRIVAIGTTSVRTLESMPDPSSPGFAAGEPLAWSTDLLIQPGHRFRRVDSLLTNFHLPRSTLLALVGAMTGLDRIRHVYEEAIRRRYRFFSYGDAMFIHRPRSDAAGIGAEARDSSIQP